VKIYLANYQPDRLGGGWSFARNFVKGMGDSISSYEDADIFFVTSASMTTREDVAKAKADGKKVVLRVDNILRPSRNRGGGMSHMRDYAEAADLVVYQSRDAYMRLANFLGKNGKIILNSTDESIFYPSKHDRPLFSYLYSRYNRDETKNFEIARDHFAAISQHISNEDIEPQLTIVGQFSQELQEYNFDFYNGENVRFMGTVSDPNTMADIYRNNIHLIYTYWRDACSNTLIEALMCDMHIVFPDDYFKKGSANEIITLFDIYGRDYFMLHRMCSEYKNAMEAL
jgi:glycosyltransferase involved in cell wall biosynthesis